MDEQTILKLVEKYESQARKNYDALQETGARRYYNAYVLADDMASALRIAANSKTTAEEAVFWRTTMAEMARRAEFALIDAPDKEQRLENFAKYVLELGKMEGLHQ